MKFVGEGFDGVMQQVADVAGGQTGLRADFFVGKVVVKFEPDEFAAAVIEGFDAEAYQADAFEAGDLFVGKRLGIGGFVGGGFVVFAGFQGNDFGEVAAMVEGEVVDGAVKPFAGLADVVKLCMQSHESFLDDVLGSANFADKTDGVGQEGRFESFEELFDRIPSRLGAGFVWSHHGHARLS